MKRFFCLLGFIIIFSNFYVNAQEHQTEIMLGLRRRILVLEIEAKVLDRNDTGETHEIIWNETHYRTTFPGNPVGIKLVGSNVAVQVQFTPVIRRHGNVLVTHGQIFINDPEKGICHYTSFQTIPLEFGEIIHFYPLGTSANAMGQFASSIEISLKVYPQAVSIE